MVVVRPTAARVFPLPVIMDLCSVFSYLLPHQCICSIEPAVRVTMFVFEAKCKPGSGDKQPDRLACIAARGLCPTLMQTPHQRVIWDRLMDDRTRLAYAVLMHLSNPISALSFSHRLFGHVRLGRCSAEPTCQIGHVCLFLSSLFLI